MSIRNVLDRLCRPDTHDEARQFSDLELKQAAESAVNELSRRGWKVRQRGLSRPNLTFIRDETL